MLNSCSGEQNVTKTRAEIADAVSYHPEACTSSTSEATLMEIALQLLSVISVLPLSMITENASWESAVNYNVLVQ